MEKNMDKMPSQAEKGGDKQPVFARELWFTAGGDEMEALRRKVEQGELTATIRLGDRSSSTKDPKGGYDEGRYITIRLQGQDQRFDPFEKEAVVLSSEVKQFGDVLSKDLAGTLFGGKAQEELRKRLEAAYGRTVGDEDTVTLVKFEYQDALRSADDLIRTKVLSLAKQPQGNPENLDFKQYTLPLLEHDYPAKTAIMWNEAYKAFGMEARNGMLVGDPAFTKEILEVLRRDPKYLGGGAGVGFKDEAIKHLDELDELAEAVGSVNFLLKTAEGKLKGYNTDGLGYARSLEEVFFESGKGALKDKLAVILGAGGTGNAVAFALAERGMSLSILNRTVAKAGELAKKINQRLGAEIASFGGEDKIADEVKNADAIINVSTKGSAGVLASYSALAPAILPATPENIRRNLEEAERILGTISKRAVLSDIVLTQQETPFLRAAKGKGFVTLDGVPMVVNQGVEAFWILHGKELERNGISKERVAEVMKKAAYQK